METLIKNIIYCQTACLSIVYLCTVMWKYTSGFSIFVLTTGNILLRSMPKQMEIFCPTAQHLCHGSLLVHKLRVIAAVKLQLDATYIQHFALKSVYEKRRWIMGGKLFSSKIIFELSITCLWRSDSNSSYDALVERSIDQVKIGYLHHFYVCHHYHQF